MIISCLLYSPFVHTCSCCNEDDCVCVYLSVYARASVCCVCVYMCTRAHVGAHTRVRLYVHAVRVRVRRDEGV